MRSRDVVGWTIVAVRQERFHNKQTGRIDVDVTCLVLQKGNKRKNIYPVTIGIGKTYPAVGKPE